MSLKLVFCKLLFWMENLDYSLHKLLKTYSKKNKKQNIWDTNTNQIELLKVRKGVCLTTKTLSTYDETKVFYCSSRTHDSSLLSHLTHLRLPSNSILSFSLSYSFFSVNFLGGISRVLDTQYFTYSLSRLIFRHLATCLD